jgi:hypothetical protein
MCEDYDSGCAIVERRPIQKGSRLRRYEALPPRRGRYSPAFINSKVSKSGTRSITSFAAPFSPVPNV